MENERTGREARVLAVGRQMLTAARTAPKGRGVDLIECALLDRADIAKVSAVMKELHAETGRPVFARDSENILKADAMVVIATHIQPLGLNCGHCGFTCGDKPKEAPCAINSVDVGIAIGSAVATAADNRIDCRVMFSAGVAAQRMNLLDDCKQYFCIPLSSSSKNPFFDR
jgi:uncharacterized ferredoxin-like protein